MGKIKITFESYGIKHFVSIDEDCTIHELMQVITNLIQSITFPTETIKNGYEHEIARIEEGEL